MAALPPQIPKDKVRSLPLPPIFTSSFHLNNISLPYSNERAHTNTQADPHKMSQAANLQHATQKVNRFAKRDPALYPLSFIVAGGLCAAGYFLYVPSSSPFLSSLGHTLKRYPSGADPQYDQDNPGRDTHQIDG